MREGGGRAFTEQASSSEIECKVSYLVEVLYTSYGLSSRYCGSGPWLLGIARIRLVETPNRYASDFNIRAACGLERQD